MAENQEKNKGGRPLKYETPEELQIAIDEYFDNDAYIGEGDTRMFAPTITGLALSLGLSRQALLDYQNKDEFLDTVKIAKARVAVALEQRLYGSNVTGVIFNLKNNFGWVDRVETKNETSINIDGMDESEIDSRIAEIQSKLNSVSS